MSSSDHETITITRPVVLDTDAADPNVRAEVVHSMLCTTAEHGMTIERDSVRLIHDGALPDGDPDLPMFAPYERFLIFEARTCPAVTPVARYVGNDPDFLREQAEQLKAMRDSS